LHKRSILEKPQIISGNQAPVIAIFSSPISANNKQHKEIKHSSKTEKNKEEKNTLHTYIVHGP